MVRSRRVRAVVACARNDECCSPNPKRKDQTALKGKLSHNSTTTITNYFNTVKTNHLPETILEVNDLDDVEKEKFKELPDVVIDDYKEDKLPSTPHRIELREELKEIDKLKDLRDETKEMFKEIQLPLNCEEKDEEQNAIKIEQRVVEEVPIQVENTKTKARRRLNTNQAANQQQSLKSQPKTNAENKGINHKLTDFFPVRRSERKTKKIVLEEKQRTLIHNLRNGIENGLDIYHFEGKGRGVVALRLFNRGDFVVEYAGDLIDMQEARRREVKYAQDQNTGCYMYYFKHKNTQYCIDATAESGKLGRLVNHSRNGNLITRVIDVDNKPRLVLVAKDTIEIGEEVTYDYGDRSKESLRHHPWLAY